MERDVYKVFGYILKDFIFEDDKMKIESPFLYIWVICSCIPTYYTYF